MRHFLFLLACAGAACGGDEREQPDAGPDASGPSFPAGEPDVLITQRLLGNTSVHAFWTDDAPLDPYHVLSLSGPCVLREAEPYGCGFDCDDGICIGATCHPYPVGLSAGQLTVAGGAQTLELDPHDGSYDYFGGVLFGGGDRIAVSATGAEVPAFEIESRAVVDLEAPGIDDLELVAGEAFEVRWTPADPDSRVRLILESDQHGQFSPTVVECDVVDDAGSITVPASMVHDFWASPGACGECPVQTLVRYNRVQTTAGDRTVMVEYGSGVTFYPYGDPY